MIETVRDLGGHAGREDLTISGTGFKAGDIVFTADGLAASVQKVGDVANGDVVAVTTDAIVNVDAASATTFSVGEPVWFNTTSKLAVAENTTGARPIGRAMVAKTNGQLFVVVRLNSNWSIGSNRSLVVRRRCTAAEVNAGVIVLPAVSGWRYRVNDVTMISIGGAAAGATSVNVSGTQSTTGVNLLAVAVAALTQSAVVRAGAANATVLADGASFTQCDANTAISVSKTGATLTGSTNVDVLISYAIEPA